MTVLYHAAWRIAINPLARGARLCATFPRNANVGLPTRVHPFCWPGSSLSNLFSLLHVETTQRFTRRRPKGFWIFIIRVAFFSLTLDWQYRELVEKIARQICTYFHFPCLTLVIRKTKYLSCYSFKQFGFTAKLEASTFKMRRSFYSKMALHLHGK